MNMSSSGLEDLLQQAEQLTAEMDSGGELPRVERNLNQIMEAAQRMASRAPLAPQDSRDVKASLLLGSRGYDLQKTVTKLEGLSTAKTFEPLEPVRDTDIQGFLRNERENALLATIEQTRMNTFERTKKNHWEALENEWEREKQKILNALVGSGTENFDFPQEEETTFLDSISAQGRSTMDCVELAYARQVFIYNEQVIQGGLHPNLVEMIVHTSDQFEEKSVTELWNMVKYMTEVPVTTSGSTLQMRSKPQMQRAFVDQAKKYLEESYKKFINTTIYSNLQEAKLGGIPGTFHLVKSFLNVKKPDTMSGLEKGRVQGHPVWPMIYYCLRCGDLKAAMEVCKQAEGQDIGNFPEYLQDYAQSEDHRLSQQLETDIRLHYRRSIKHSHDPFMRAAYCIIGRCDPNDDHAEIADKIDDYLWLKLSQLSYESEESCGTAGSVLQDRLTLPELQKRLLEDYGESHFAAYQQPFLYFQVLLLTAQFEAGIEFLSRIERLRCHAVHIALVLHQLHLLLMPHNTQSQLLSKDSSDPSPMRRLNFARLVMMYTRKFETTDPQEALQYFYFLRDMKTNQGDNLFMTCISELVLETREFDMLLGQLNKDGSRQAGAIDKFHKDTQKIIELVAKDTENKGQFKDSVRLYDLANQHDKVLELLNKLVAGVLSQPPTPQSNRDRVRRLALTIAERYRSLGYRGSQHNTSTFYLLLDLMTFFDLYHSNKYDQSYQVIKDLKLLPLTSDEVDQKVSAFRHYTDEVRRSLPEILLATMNILHSQYKNTRSSGSQSPMVSYSLGLRRKEDGGQETFINFLRAQARSLITFAGMIPYRMPGDTNARLVQIEALMN